MLFPNRITRYYSRYILSFILTASSIPNIQANTNPENLPIVASIQNETPENPQLAQATTNPDTAAIQEPVEIHLDILAGMCQHAINAIEKGKWNLPHNETEKKALTEMLEKTFTIACDCLQTFEGGKPDINTQYFYEIVVHHLLTRINDLLLRTAIPEADLEAQI